MAKKLAVSAKAARILRKVKAHILEEPRRIAMEYFNMPLTKEEIQRDKNLPPCGTQACIAGWAVRLQHKGKVRGNVRYESAARRIIGLTRSQADNLFFFQGWNMDSRGWPERFADAYDNAYTPARRARIAARRIEHFIKTGE